MKIPPFFIKLQPFIKEPVQYLPIVSKPAVSASGRQIDNKELLKRMSVVAAVTLLAIVVISLTFKSPLALLFLAIAPTPILLYEVWRANKKIKPIR